MRSTIQASYRGSLIIARTFNAVSHGAGCSSARQDWERGRRPLLQHHGDARDRGEQDHSLHATAGSRTRRRHDRVRFRAPAKRLRDRSVGLPPPPEAAHRGTTPPFRCRTGCRVDRRCSWTNRPAVPAPRPAWDRALRRPAARWGRKRNRAVAERRWVRATRGSRAGRERRAAGDPTFPVHAGPPPRTPRGEQRQGRVHEFRITGPRRFPRKRPSC